jgi:lysozyme family protein
MVADNYEEALKRLLAHEGGYSNHPSDPGGPTRFGITIHDYRKYVKPDASAADVRAMPLAHAKAIYRDRYWDAMRCDALPAGLDYAVFDYGVNSGVSRAVKVLRRLVGLSESAQMNDAVIADVRRHDAADLVARLCDERLAFLKRLRTWPVFGAGWSRRVAEVRRAALAMAKGPQSSPSRQSPPPRAVGEERAPLGWLRRKMKGWKTIVFGTALTGAGVAADLLDAAQAVDLAPLLPPAHAVRIIAAIGLLTIVLRLVTSGRIGQKDC